MVADRLGVLGADVVPPSPQVIANLSARKIAVNDAPITDLPMGSAEGGRYAAILSELIASDHCDCAIAVIGSSAGEREVIESRILATRHRDRKPLAVYLAPIADQSLALLEENGVAGFRSPEACADSVNAYLNWRAPVERGAATAGELAAADEVLLRSKGARFDERRAGELFAALGVPVAKSRLLAGPNDGADFDGPVALKVVSADIPHKTEAGAVRLNVTPGPALAAAYQEILANARQHKRDARIEGVLAQRMESGLAEVIVGYRNDPEVGPVVLLGMGGVAAELKRSYCVRIAPVSLEEAAAMIGEVRELALLRGFRNLPRGDCAALARAIRSLSLLAVVGAGTVSEAEINPLIVKREGEGVVAVDGLVVFDDGHPGSQKAEG
jgi:acyl-CoA synthetase (NDP forming)